MLSCCLISGVIHRFPLSALTVSEGIGSPAQLSQCSFLTTTLMLILALSWFTESQLYLLLQPLVSEVTTSAGGHLWSAAG